ncbi:unnamed protein product, partial [Cladocopium goreaui]
SLPSPEHVSESLKTPVPAIIGPLRDRHLRGRTDEKAWTRFFLEDGGMHWK